jgi:hypothetical protein
MARRAASRSLVSDLAVEATEGRPSHSDPAWYLRVLPGRLRSDAAATLLLVVA